MSSTLAAFFSSVLSYAGGSRQSPGNGPGEGVGKGRWRRAQACLPRLWVSPLGLSPRKRLHGRGKGPGKVPGKGLGKGPWHEGPR